MNQITKRRTLRKCILVLLMATVLLGMTSVSSFAATLKLKNQIWTQKEAKARKKALTVRPGTVTVRIPSGGRGFLKFTVPKTGKWTFTLSNLKAAKPKMTKKEAEAAKQAGAAAASYAQTSKATSGKASLTSLKASSLVEDEVFSNGYFYVMTRYLAKDKKTGKPAWKIGQDLLQTSGGKTNTLWLATEKLETGANKLSWRLKTRSGRINLEKGKTVYLYFSFTPGDQVKLQISRK